MRNLLNPRWLYVINTLPIIVLFVIFTNQFNIIKPLLNDTNIQYWEIFGLTLGVMTVLSFIYATYLVIKKREISVLYGIIALICHIAFLYIFEYYIEDTIPFNIPQWMMSENIYVYVGTFLMPTIAYSLFILMVALTPNAEKRNALTDFATALSIPLVGYLFTLTVLPLWEKVETGFNGHVILIIIIVLTLTFMFFVVRGIYVLVLKSTDTFKKYKLLWKIPIAIIFPLLGLMVNNGYLFNSFTHSNSGMLGNFNNPWFIILAVVNGILICLPNIENKMYRLFLFYGRSLTLSYTLYFFLVLLPFLPFSVVIIIVFGLGLLMLTPLLLLVIHINELFSDFQFLKTMFRKRFILTIALFGFVTIPSIITITYIKDKIILNETLEYLYSPNYSKHYNIDKESLSSTLDVIKKHKNKSNQDFNDDAQVPFLSSYYNWLALDNLTLSDAKIIYIEKIFFGDDSFSKKMENIPNNNNNNVQNNNTVISKISTNSQYDKSQNAWRSWVNLEITNKSNNEQLEEFSTKMKLPDGCWISDYYLYVGNKKEKGILAEKKTAMWVFSNIKNERKDPGILYYLTGNDVALKVYPFSKNEVRKTGIEFLHKEPIKLDIDGNTVTLGDNEVGDIDSHSDNDNAAYVSAKQKQSLKKVCRKPYFHFIMDVSKGKKYLSDYFIKEVENTIENNKELAKDAKISFVNTYTNTVALNKGWKEKYKSQNFEGGFFLDRSIRTELAKCYKDNSYPIFVVVSLNIKDAIIEKDFSDFQFAFPECSSFYHLKKYKLEAHSLLVNPLMAVADGLPKFSSKTVLKYDIDKKSSVFIPNNNKPSLVLKKEIFEVADNEMKEKKWESALTMQAKHISNILHPEISKKEWIKLVKYSFMTRVMTPETSFLVVENEAQKNVLKKKQEQVLSGNKSLDINEDTPRMSEPNVWILIALIILVLWFKEKSKFPIFKKIK